MDLLAKVLVGSAVTFVVLSIALSDGNQSVTPEVTPKKELVELDNKPTTTSTPKEDLVLAVDNFRKASSVVFDSLIEAKAAAKQSNLSKELFITAALISSASELRNASIPENVIDTMLTVLEFMATKVWDQNSPDKEKILDESVALFILKISV